MARHALIRCPTCPKDLTDLAFEERTAHRLKCCGMGGMLCGDGIQTMERALEGEGITRAAARAIPARGHGEEGPNTASASEGRSRKILNMPS